MFVSRDIYLQYLKWKANKLKKYKFNKILGFAGYVEVIGPVEIDVKFLR